jgi:hypothetical protein
MLHGVRKSEMPSLTQSSGSITKQDSYSMGATSVCPRLKRPRREANHSSPLVTKQRTNRVIPPFLYMISLRGRGHYLLTSDRNLCDERWVAIQEWHWTVVGLLEITRTDGRTDRKFLYGLLQDLQIWRFILHCHTSTAAAALLQATFGWQDSCERDKAPEEQRLVINGTKRRQQAL